MSSELDLFTLPAAQTFIEGSSSLNCKPVSSVTDESDAPIEFVVPSASGEHYIDLANTMLFVKAQILPIDEPDGNLIVGPVNNLLHSMFNQIGIFLNQKYASPPNNTYPYKAYIESLLSYSPAAKESHLTASLWYDDTAECMEGASENQGVGSNKGLIQRQYFTRGAKSFDMIGHLYCDLFNQDKMLIIGVEMRVRLVRTKDAFCLIDSTNNGRFGIKKRSYSHCLRVKINPCILIAHANTLAKATAKYPITRDEVKTFTLHTRILGDSIDNATLGQLSKPIIIGFIDNRAFNGNRALNRFNFQHFDINYLSLVYG